MFRRNLVFSFLLILISHSLSAIEYHFQEGFATSSPSGWVRQCNSTTTVNHTGLSFSGAYAVKFDATGSGRYGKNLISPQVTGADSLSFYVSKNANATYMTLYVGKVMGADTTLIGTYNAYDFPNKSGATPFARISIPLLDATNNFKIIFYATVSTDPQYVNAGWFVVDDVELTKYSGTVTPPVVTSVDKICTDFGDGTWGTIATTAYASGSYPSSTINGFNLVKAYLYTGSMACPSGETHTNRILLGKNSEGAALELPTLNTVGEVEIHAVTGTAGNSFRLEEWVNNAWQTIGTYTTIKSPDSIYTIPLQRSSPTKLRIANNTSSGLYVYKLLTRTLQETQELNLKSSSPVENEVCFSNLKKKITLTFNKSVSVGQGMIQLNDQQIPLSSCIVNANSVEFTVSLGSSTTENKAYTLTVPAGAFTEQGVSGNLSKQIILHFNTLRTVAYPSNYNALIDIVYKNVNSTNCRMDLYYPANAVKPVPVVINMHGGGWNHGYKEEQGGFSLYFNKGYAVANVEYRMTGEAKAPAAVEDVRGAMMYLLNHADEFNIDRSKIIFQGGSAGGHLALISGYLMNNSVYDNDCVRYTGNYKIIAVIDKYGPSKLVDFMYYSSLVDWLGTRSSDQGFVDSLSPVSYVNANTPSTYIIHGDVDPTVPYSQSVTLQAALQSAGVKNKFTTVPGGLHGSFPDQYNNQMEIEVDTFLSEVVSMQTSVGNLSNATSELSIEGNRIVVNSKENFTIRVVDFSGKELIRSTNKTVVIPRKGIYIVHVISATKESVSKIIIQ